MANTVSTTFAQRRLWTNIRHVLALAVPVALAELGWIAMNVVDTIMVGHLGPSAIGAIAIGGSTFYAFAIFGTGLLLGLDTLVAQAFGADDREDCHKSLATGIYLVLFITPMLMLFFNLAPSIFEAIGIERRERTRRRIYSQSQLKYTAAPALQRIPPLSASDGTRSARHVYARQRQSGELAL